MRGAMLFLALGCIGAAQAAEPPQPAKALTVEEAVQTALRNNRYLRVAELEREKSRDLVRPIEAKLYPDLSLGVDEAGLLAPVNFRFPQGAFGTFPGIGSVPSQDTDVRAPAKFTTLVNVIAIQPITQIPRIKLGVELQKDMVRLSEQTVRKQRQTVAHDVRVAFNQVLQACAARNAAQAGLEYVKELERSANEAVGAGAALDHVALEAMAKRIEVEQKLRIANNAVASARAKLNLVMGVPIDSDYEPTTPPDPAVECYAAEFCRQAADAQRPEVRQAQIKLDQAQRALRLRNQEDRPDLSLFLAYSRPYNLDVMPDQVLSLGLRLSWKPIDWGKKKAELDARSAEVEQARAALAETRESVCLEVDVRRRALEEAAEQVKAARAMKKATQERVRVVSRRLESGAATNKDLLEARSLDAQADASLVTAQTGVMAALSALDQAMGVEQ